MAEENYTDNSEAENHDLEQPGQPEIHKLRQEIAFLTNQLRFDAKAKGMIAGSAIGYSLAMHRPLGEKLAFLFAGAMIGARMFTRELTQQEKDACISGINQRAQRLRFLEAVERGNSANAGPNVVSSSELSGMAYERYRLSPKWRQFMGDPSKNFHAIIFGRPKQGKSILSLQLASELARHGRTLYIAAEEGIGPTLDQKISDFASGADIKIANWRNLQQITEGLRSDPNYDFVFIDSISYAKLSVDDIRAIKKEFPRIAFICVMQATKNGNFRGSQEYAHDCDVVIAVEAGIAAQEGRFAPPAEMPVFS